MAADLEPSGVVICSACLLGVPCRYDGRDKRSAAVLRFLEGRAVVPICPEAAAGLGIPRPAVHIEGTGPTRQWRDAAGVDRTAAFELGAQLATEAARRHGATVALLKEGSPSCGARRVFGRSGPMEGRGAAAQALASAGLRIISDEDLI